MSVESDFITLLCSKKWSSAEKNTLHNKQFNKYPSTDWRSILVNDNSDYYPPLGVDVEIEDHTYVKEAYKAPNGLETDDIYIPDTAIYTFTMKVTGKDFQGKAHLNEARFIVLGDHAVSTPMLVNRAEGKSIIMVVRVKDFGNNKLVMVNDIIWSVQFDDDQTKSQKFYDMQKWYCCGR